MKKIISLSLICCMLICSLSAFATAENIVIDGENAVIPSDMGKIVEMNDRTYVPIRFVMEYLGCVVNYQETTQTQNGKSQVLRTATITDPKTKISYFTTANDNKIFILGSQASTVNMDTPVFINEDEGRMYIPIRFLAQALGYTVGWNEETQTVSLTSAE